jgi:hypothetical protein
MSLLYLIDAILNDNGKKKEAPKARDYDISDVAKITLIFGLFAFGIYNFVMAATLYAAERKRLNARRQK